MSAWLSYCTSYIAVGRLRWMIIAESKQNKLYQNYEGENGTDNVDPLSLIVPAMEIVLTR